MDGATRRNRRGHDGRVDQTFVRRGSHRDHSCRRQSEEFDPSKNLRVGTGSTGQFPQRDYRFSPSTDATEAGVMASRAGKTDSGFLCSVSNLKRITSISSRKGGDGEFSRCAGRSLLLTKATNETPHGGRIQDCQGSLDYNLLHSWIAQGMPYGEKDDPVLEEVAVFPSKRVMDMNGEQQLVVTAKYSDGSLKDATRSSIFEVNDEEVGEVDLNGHVKAFEQPGDLGVMIRFQSKVTVFRAIVPTGAPVDDLPPPSITPTNISSRSSKRWACLRSRSARTPLSFAGSPSISRDVCQRSRRPRPSLPTKTRPSGTN